MERLIIEALKSAWGNRNIKFQVAVQNGQLHIYVNHRRYNRPDYLLLSETVAAAIASLNLDSVDRVRLYCRPLGQVAPDWQTTVELFQARGNLDDIDTIGTTEEQKVLDNLVTESYSNELELPQVSSATEIDFSERKYDVAADPNAITDLEIHTTWKKEFDSSEDDNAGDTGLLYSSGLVHDTYLQEEQLGTVPDSIELAIEKSDEPEPANDLAQYCFVTNRKLLTSDLIAPRKEITRLVKFFHHLNGRNQFKLLPILEIYFQRGETSNLDDLSLAVQKWLGQIKELNYDDQQILAIWLSRYCYDSAATLEEFKAIEAGNSEKAKTGKAGYRSTEYSFTLKTNRIKPQKESKPPETQSRQSSQAKKLLLPGAWILATIVLLVVALANNNFNSIASDLNLCRNTIGSPEYCRLAVNLAGEKAIARPPQSLFSLTEVTETVATYGCQRYANLKAAITPDLDPKKTPPIFSFGEKIFSHLYVVRVEQKNAQGDGNVNVGCVYTTGGGQRSPKLLAADVIPVNWPSEPYQNGDNNLSFGKYSVAIDLGLYTIFAAWGIAVASWMNLGIKTNCSKTIYLAALVLGIMQLVASTIPVFSSIARVILPILAILAINRTLDDFKIAEKYGGAAFAAGIFTIVAVQLILYGVCLGLINSLM